MKRCLALVLGGGGARGALQVGALQALLGASIVPDLLVGTSIGAVNAAGLAFWGLNASGIGALEHAYQQLADANLMDRHVERLAVRAMLGRENGQASRRMAEFLISKGITPDVRFDQAGVRLAMVATDLEAGQPVIYGQDPGQSVFSGLLASTAVPPWFAPLEEEGKMIIDGGFVSNLPIEAAVTLGATEIIALDLDDPRPASGKQNAASQLLEKLLFIVSQRYKRLDTALAEARGVPVRCIELRGPGATPLWDFGNSEKLIQAGYAIGCRKIAEWTNPEQVEKDAGAIAALIEALGSEDGLVRQDARAPLVHLGARAVPALLAALAAPQELHRWEAAMALRDIAGPEAAPALVRALEDESSRVRWTAAEGLVALRQDALIPLLQALVHYRPSPWLYEGAHHVLNAFDRRNVLPPVVRGVLVALDQVEPDLTVPPSAQAALYEMVSRPGPCEWRF